MPWDHKHTCLCGKIFWCRFDILPYQESRALCREWPDSICDSCIEIMRAAQGDEILKSFATVADPSASWRALNVIRYNAGGVTAR